MEAARFLRDLIEALPYKIHTVLTDNGIQFTNHKSDRCTFPHIFDRVCEDNDIEHRLSKVNHPWSNDQVERMNRTLEEATVKRYHDDIAKATCCVIIQVMTYPLKFRQKVFATKKKFKLTFEQTSERFDIPIRTLFRWQKKIQPCLRRNKPATKLDMDRLAKDVQRAPDDYQWERAKRLNVSQRTIGYGLKRLGMTYKKRSNAPKRIKRRMSPSKKDKCLSIARACHGHIDVIGAIVGLTF